MRSFFIFLFLINSMNIFGQELPFVKYPFHPERVILCDQGAQSPAGNSHSYSNSLYALDLGTPKEAEPAGLFASVSGRVITYDKCVEHNTQCGAGFGNHVKILADNGILVFYAHLEKIVVRTGDYINQGQLIGVEGNTGWTGENNRHLHYSVHYDWRDNDFNFYKETLGSLPHSIPFKMNICQKQYVTCSGQPLDVRELKCKRITGNMETVNSF